MSGFSMRVSTGALALFIMGLPATTVEAQQPTTTNPPARPEAVVHLQAPQALLDLWTKWNGQYVLYGHKAAGITRLQDLNGMDLFVAFINGGDLPIIPDAIAFMEAAGLKMNLHIQNNPEAYQGQFLESRTRVGFMVPSVATSYRLDYDETLVRIEFELAPPAPQ